MRRPTACVLGDWDLLRPLALAGVACTVAGPDASLLRWSRHVRATVLWPEDADPATVVDLLLGAHAKGQEPVLFYGSDRTLALVSRNRDRLSDRYRFVIGDPDLVEVLSDKVRFADLADRRRLPVPPSRIVHPRAEPPAVAVEVGLPVVLKPTQHEEPGWDHVGRGQKALFLATRRDVEAAWPELQQRSGPLVAQRAVLGDETRIESYHTYVDESGRPVAEFTGRKVRTLPRRHGYSTAVQITDVADVRALGRALVDELGLTGVAKIDMKRDADGRLWLLEINPRFSLWHHPAALAGVNIPELVMADVTGRPRPPVGPVRSGVTWMDPLDRRAAQEWGLPMHRWLAELASCDAYSLFSWGDPGPFVALATRRLRRSSSRVP